MTTVLPSAIVTDMMCCTIHQGLFFQQPPAYRRSLLPVIKLVCSDDNTSYAEIYHKHCQTHVIRQLNNIFFFKFYVKNKSLPYRFRS